MTQEYQQATGSKGKPKTKEAKNLLKNWGKSLKETLTKFCKIAKKVAKDTIKTGISFGTGFMVQVLENNMVKPIAELLFGEWKIPDWITQNSAYNAGIRAGQVTGFLQAALEYAAAAALFAGGTGASLAAAPVTGGASLAAIPVATEAATGILFHATGVLGATIISMMEGDNYGSGTVEPSGGSNSVIKVNNMNEFFETNFGKTLRNKLRKTNERYDGQTIYEITENIPPFKKGDKLYLDGLHKDHLEIFNKNGKIKDVINLDGTRNVDKLQKASGRKLKK